MGAPVANIIHVELDVGQLTDEALGDLVTGILQQAPLGLLYTANPPLQAAVTAIGTADTAYKAASVVVIASEAKLVTDKQAEADARALLITKVLQYRGLVETTATNHADVKGAGVKPLTRTPPSAITVPTGIDIFYPKKGHGRAKVSVQETGPAGRYNAQLCLDLTANVWTDLPGDGRSHWLTTYKTGTVVWVRYRTVRGHQWSDWCAPVSVTIP